MITTHKQLIDHNLRFFEAVVDAKVNAWKGVSRAFNTYTMSFFNEQLKKGDEMVESIGKNMKEAAALAKEV